MVRTTSHMEATSVSKELRLESEGKLLKHIVHVGAPPRYAPSHGISFSTQGFHQPKASVVSHKVSPLPPDSSDHLDMYTTDLHTREGISSSPAHQYDAAPHEKWRVTARDLQSKVTRTSSARGRII